MLEKKGLDGFTLDGYLNHEANSSAQSGTPYKRTHKTTNGE